MLVSKRFWHTDVVAQPDDGQNIGERDGAVDADTRSQMMERLRWTPAQRLAYLRQQLAFERRARAARRIA